MLRSGSALPEAPEDFERLVLSQPNSSFVWIQYMAHFLSTADIDAARRVGDADPALKTSVEYIVANKALNTINFREEDEKFNVWVAWLNLEHKYGSMESLEAAFLRAIQESKSNYHLLTYWDFDE